MSSYNSESGRLLYNTYTAYASINSEDLDFKKMATPGKLTENGVYEFPYMRKVDNTPKWEKFKKGIYNTDTHEFIGRTAKSWAGILLFYVIFFSGLAALFAICMHGLMATLDENRPKWILDESRIGVNPGLGFRPISPVVEEGSLIWYIAKNQTSVKKWTDELDTFLEAYLDNSKLPPGTVQQVCDFDQLPGKGKVCAVEVNSWGPCSSKEGYSFNRSSPCVFIKLNRIYGWEPEYYNDTTNLPSEMPDDLVDHIKKLNPIQRNQIWISCKGENPYDEETLNPVEYYPGRGFPNYYYPYTNTKGYLSPLVAVRFLRPTVGVLINIECRAWAKNMLYRGGHREREGSVHFELMID